MKYTLRTIKDIFDKVPTDRIAVCMEELSALLVTTKGMSELMAEGCNTLYGTNLPSVIHELPDELVWDDDGKGEIIGHIATGAQVLTVKTTRSEKARSR
jgi:hypothetical protein